MIPIIFICLMVILVLAFLDFDRLIKIEYKNYKEEWIDDRKPCGFFWRTSECTWFSSTFAMQGLSMKWLFSTPKWVINDVQARVCLRRFRLLIIFNAGAIGWGALLALAN